MGWIGVDLDGTLAMFNGWRGPEHIGPPIPKMHARVKQWLDEGVDVRIVTARAHSNNPPEYAKVVIDWCIEHFGMPLPVTAEKDFLMLELWDDRAIQVKCNTGERVDGGD